MPALSDYTSGTIALTNGSTAFTGSGTGWQAADFREGDTILGIEDNAGVEYVIATITGNGAGTLTQEWEGATGTYQYRMRYLADGARVTAQARNLIELLGNGNLQALAGLTGPGVPVFNGPHAMTIRPTTDFINGVAYDVQVDTLADRAAYNGQSAGFSVLVSNMGDGRSALFSKASNASGDWTDAAYITGPSVSVTVGTTTEGPFGSDPDVTGVTGAGTLQLNFELPGSPSIDATVTSASPGTPASVITTPVAGGYELDFTLPGASGFYNAGVYDIGEAYSLDEVVRHNGSSFIALQAVPAGQSPSSASPPVDTAYWQVLAAKGADGSGTGDVVGPSSATNNRIAVFDGTTGKLIKDGGSTIAEIVPGPNSVTNTILADMVTARIKGRVTAGTGDPEDLTAAQVRTLLANDLRSTLGGSANAITLTSPAALVSGLSVRFRATAANTGAATIAFNGGAAVACRTVTGVALPAGYIRTDVDTEAIYDGTFWVLGREIESGTNANGTFTRFADGSLICSFTDTVAITTSTNVSGTPFYNNSKSVVFPVQFNIPPDLSPYFLRTIGGIAHFGSSAGVTGTGAVLYGTAGNAASAGVVGYLAKGTWY